MSLTRLSCALLVGGLGVLVPVPLAATAAVTGTNGPIAYVRIASNNCPDILRINPAGGGSAKLTNCPEAVGDPAWNAAGNRIAYAATTQAASGGGPGPLDLYTMGPTGAAVHRVTNDNTEDADPSWSSNGATLVEGRGRSGPDSVNIATVAATGGTPSNLVTGSAGSEAGEPNYSPDGAQVVFQQHDGPTYDIFTMDTNGANITNVTPASDGNSEFPVWSPDSSKIAFASDDSGKWQIWVMDANGANRHEITSDDVDHIQPAWSPDQTTIAFTRGCDIDNCQGNSGFENGDIYTVGVSDLTAPGTPVALVATANAEFDPAWGTACTSNCGPTTVARSVSLSLSRHLTAAGTVAVLSGTRAACINAQHVRIQRRTSRGWTTVRTATTNTKGHYSKSLPNRSGRYRAVAIQSTPTNLDCSQATSPTRSFTAHHARRIPYFNLAAFSTGIFANGRIRASDGYDRCTNHQPVKIQKASGSTWTTIATSLGKPTGTNGVANFGKNIPRRNGLYRAHAARKRLTSGDICGGATSRKVRYPIQ